MATGVENNFFASETKLGFCASIRAGSYISGDVMLNSWLKSQSRQLDFCAFIICTFTVNLCLEPCNGGVFEKETSNLIPFIVVPDTPQFLELLCGYMQLLL
jgi:hypothetical protein